MMDQTVALLVAAVALFGTAIGLRFSVYILVPAGLAVLIGSAIAQLISNKTAGWGIKGTIGLLVLLNSGFALGLVLRAAAAYWSTKRIERLFRPARKAGPVRRLDDGVREAGGDGCVPTAAITPRDLAKESFRR
jgi:hypothetical protein